MSKSFNYTFLFVRLYIDNIENRFRQYFIATAINNNYSPNAGTYRNQVISFCVEPN